MKRLVALLLVSALCLATLEGWATGCEGGSNRGVFYGADARL